MYVCVSDIIYCISLYITVAWGYGHSRDPATLQIPSESGACVIMMMDERIDLIVLPARGGKTGVFADGWDFFLKK